MKLAGGSPTLAPQLNLEAFIEQAKAYDTAISDDLGETLRMLQNAQLTHPVPVIRAREIERWSSSSQYHNLLQQSVTSTGGWRNW